jgi:hypothetical protein|tara:strand:+ start:3128 stop:3550 length:423 start_codon:yes stop_codon:yes gene_type:complete
LSEPSLLDLKRGSVMKTIKDTPTGVDSPGTIVERMEQEWPEMTQEFKRLQREQYELFCHKQHDYGPGNISVGTQLITDDEIHLSLTGLWFRMNDKIQRLKTLLMGKRGNAVEGEPMEDAYLDVSNYGIMATIVKNGKWGK